MGNEEEFYGHAVVLGLCNNSCQCSKICGIFCRCRTYCEIPDSKVKEVKVNL